MIGIIDYGMGNLRSVQKAFEHLGFEALVLSSPQQVSDVGQLVLPGVGAYGDGMAQLTERGWVQPIMEAVDSGRPFLGICLGMQLLFESSEEGAADDDALVPGLGLLPGRVVRFAHEVDGRRYKVPHMGWNQIHWDRRHELWRNLEPGAAVYFVHSYFVVPDEMDDAPLTSAQATYGKPFCAAVCSENVWATQFHPEKSQRVGLQMLDNFARRR